MASSYFCKNCTWMHLTGTDELRFLLDLMKREGYKAELVEAQWQNLPRLGSRLTVIFRQPGKTESSEVSYLHGATYICWEKLKSAVYRHRKACTDDEKS